MKEVGSQAATQVRLLATLFLECHVSISYTQLLLLHFARNKYRISAFSYALTAERQQADHTMSHRGTQSCNTVNITNNSLAVDSNSTPLKPNGAF
jgi:hypothetical protein